MADRSRRGGTQPQRQPAGKDPVRRGQIRRSLPGAIQDQELMLEQNRLGNDGTGTARSEQASQGGDEMDEKDDQIAHHRILAGQEIPTNYGRNNNSPADFDPMRGRFFAQVLPKFSSTARIAMDVYAQAVTPAEEEDTKARW